MPRKKTAKRNTKRSVIQKSTGPILNTQKMQKELLQAPIKLAARINKEALGLKQKENKLQSAIAKIKNQLKNTEARIKAASKSKNTAAGKKQLKVAKKVHSEALKAQTGLAKQLNEVAKALESASLEQAKLSALRKHLNQFEKEWTKQAREQKAKTKTAKPRSVKQNRKEALPLYQEPRIEPIETIIEEIRLDDVEAVTS